MSLRGPGTDLTVGLLPNARWEPPTHRNQRGIVHAWNIPSEEIYTSPDPERVDGRVCLTRPAVISGVEVRDVSRVTHPFEVILLDENATSHLALGFGYPELIDEPGRHHVNRSGDHIDLAIGSDDVQVSGFTLNGETVRLLHGGR